MVEFPFASVTIARYVPAFLAVARYRNFTKAARALHLTQPAVTMAVHQLEGFMGVRLFERNTHGVALTKHGTSFVPTAERLLVQLDSAVRDIATEPEADSRLRISAVNSVASKVLPGVIARLVANGVEDSVMLTDQSSARIRQQVKWAETDLGFASVLDPDDDLDAQPLLRDRIGVLASADHPLFARTERLRWSELVPFEVLGLRGDFAARIKDAVDDVPQNVREPAYEASYNTLLWELLRGSAKIAIVPALFAPNVAASGLAFRPLYAPEIWREVHAVTARGRSVPPLCADVIAFARDIAVAIERESGFVEVLGSA